MVKYTIGSVCIMIMTWMLSCSNSEPNLTRLYRVRRAPSGEFIVDTDYAFPDTILYQIKAVFDHYGIDSVVIDADQHTLLIPTWISRDTDYVANLIDRASDHVWKQYHFRNNRNIAPGPGK